MPSTRERCSDAVIIAMTVVRARFSPAPSHPQLKAGTRCRIATVPHLVGRPPPVKERVATRPPCPGPYLRAPHAAGQAPVPFSTAGADGRRCRTVRRKSDQSRTRSGHQPTTPAPGICLHSRVEWHKSAATLRAPPVDVRDGPPSPWPTKTSRRSATDAPHGLCPATIPAVVAGGGGVEGGREEGAGGCPVRLDGGCTTLAKDLSAVVYI
jgi:hypothetical protein